MARQNKIAPSILAADFSRLGEEVRRVEAAGADSIHVDVMDGHFVPNLSLGPAAVKAVRRVTRLPIEVHLMITDPLRYLEPFAKAGADHITYHIESRSDPRECLRWLREHRLSAGIAISPETPAERVFQLAPLVDMILVMTVHPGFGGQDFMEVTLSKIPPIRAASTKSRALERELDVEVDGGIDASTAPRAARAGANVLVAGTSIFSAPDPGQALRDLRQALERAERPVGELQGGSS